MRLCSFFIFSFSRSLFFRAFDIVLSQALTQFRPELLASYRARSALRITSLEESVGSDELSAIPQLIVIGRFSISSSCWILSRILSNNFTEFVALVSGISITNSSPPYRVSMSVVLIWVFIHSASFFSASSPAPWPNISLIVLKLSRSIIAMENNLL